MRVASPEWWQDYYEAGNISGRDSRGEQAEAKARYVNDLIRREGIASVVDWGCGDGVQQSLLEVEHYLGIDVSGAAVAQCLTVSPGRQFLVFDPESPIAVQVTAELALSMSVIYHLVRGFGPYMARLFGSASRFVCIFCTDVGRRQRDHLRHHHWTPYVERTFPAWQLVDFTPWDDDDSNLGHYLYEKR